MNNDKGSIQLWLNTFSKSALKGDGDAVAALFKSDGLWRDYLPFGWTLQTIEGHQNIAKFASQTGPKVGFRNPVFEGTAEDSEGFFNFQTNTGKGIGYIRLEDTGCLTFFTMLDDLSNLESSQKLPDEDDKNPYVLIVGGGQGGLALGAQLEDLGVSYLIVDKYPRVGDQWRSRYDSLVLHDPVWYDHMPIIPFPDDWPVFTPKDMMGDWLEDYAKRLSLKVQNNTECIGAQHNDDTGQWSVSLKQGEEISQVTTPHLVFALGIAGFPNVPEFEGREAFLGEQLHSSEYKGSQDFSEKNVVVIGANNSAHDIAADLVEYGANPVMIQRSSTLVVSHDDYCKKLLGPLFSQEAVDAGLTTDKADILTAATPMRLLEKQHKPIWDNIREENKDYYGRLTNSGFTIDFAEDGTGLGMKYRRTASGYYIDVGATEMVVDGRIAIRSGVNITKLSADGVQLDSGEHLPADAVIYATGFGSMTDWVAKLIDNETAERVGACWGYGSGTKGDPGPWLGELRNMWMPTAQEGLWFMGGNLAQARFCSRLLALQLAMRYVGAPELD